MSVILFRPQCVNIIQGEISIGYSDQWAYGRMDRQTDAAHHHDTLWTKWVNGRKPIDSAILDSLWMSSMEWLASCLYYNRTDMNYTKE